MNNLAILFYWSVTMWAIHSCCLEKWSRCCIWLSFSRIRSKCSPQQSGWLLYLFLPSKIFHLMHDSVAALFPAAEVKSVIVVFFFCNKQNNAHHLMHPWPTNPSNSLPHPHLPLLRYGAAMSLPYFTMAAASAAATPAIASSIALNIFVVVSF